MLLFLHHLQCYPFTSNNELIKSVLGYFDSLILDQDLSRSKESWLTFGPVIRKLFTDLEDSARVLALPHDQQFSTQNTENERLHHIQNINNNRSYFYYIYIAYRKQSNCSQIKTQIHSIRYKQYANCCISTYFIILNINLGKKFVI